MRTKTIPLGRILNIPIGLDYSWFLIFILLTWSLAASYYPTEFRHWPVAQYWILGAITAILMFASVLLHELGHSIIAMHYKIPVRSITLFIFGGIAQIAKEPPSAVAEFWIAIAGPVVSFSLAGLFKIMQIAVSGFSPLFALATYLAYINGMLGLFNLIPGFPLDGGRVFRAVIWGFSRNFRKATLIASYVGRFIAFGFILVGVYMMIKGNFGGGLWIAFIGWFLESASQAQVKQQALHDILTGHKVVQIMSRSFTIIYANTTLQKLADEHILGEGRRFFVVVDEYKVIGVLTLSTIKEVSRQIWPVTSVSQIMVPIERMHWVAPDTELWVALEKMDLENVNQLPVMEDQRVLGLLTRENVINFLHTLQELNATPIAG